MYQLFKKVVKFLWKLLVWASRTLALKKTIINNLYYSRYLHSKKIFVISTYIFTLLLFYKYEEFILIFK